MRVFFRGDCDCEFARTTNFFVTSQSGLESASQRCVSFKMYRYRHTVPVPGIHRQYKHTTDTRQVQVQASSQVLATDSCGVKF